jgi:hypothetical protein
MAESKIQEQDTYVGLYPTVFKRIDSTDVKVSPFQTYKSWMVVSGSVTSSALPLQAIYSDVNVLPALGSELTYNDASNIDGTLQTLTYFSVNHLFYKHKSEPMKTYGPTDLSRTNKFLYQSASILSFPQIRVGEGLKPASLLITASFLYGSVYGSSSYGTGSYGSSTIPLYIKSDRYGNLYDTSFNTASIVSGVKWYEGFNEYFDTSRISYESAGVTYSPGVATLTGYQGPIGWAAKFDGTGYIKSTLDGLYDRNHDYAISFFVSASNTGVNKIIATKASSSLTPQWPFRIELSGSNQIIFSAAGSTSFKTQITSSATTTAWTHVICQKSGSNLQMYVNGTLHASASNMLLIDTNSPFTASARIDNTGPLYIGGFESELNLTGVLDEIRIYNNALTSTQVGYLADRTEGGAMMQTNHVGNVFAKQGIAVISTPDYRFNNVINLPYTASYRSTKTIYEMGVTAKIASGDFNMSSNLSLTADDDVTYKSFATGSAFAPYITTVGLYDNAGQLLAIGKLAQPVRKRPDVDMNFLIRIDLDRNIS